MAAPAGVYFLTSRSQWNDYVLPVYALSGAAWLLGVVCDLLEIADFAPASGAGIAFLFPGALFELAFPLLLIVRSSSGRSDARLVPVSVGGAGEPGRPGDHARRRRSRHRQVRTTGLVPGVRGPTVLGRA
jgi:hypothetical protein